MDTSQLTPEMQQDAQPVTGLAAQSTASVNPLEQPLMPAGQTPVPMRPAGQLGTDQEAPQPGLESTIPGSRQLNEAPLSFAQKIARAADNLKVPAGPGGWAKSLVGAAQSALSTIGETQTQNREHPNESIFETANRVKDARLQKVQQQQKIKTEEDKDRASIAHENVQTMYQQKLLHGLDDKANHEDIDNGKSAIQNFTTHLSEVGLKPADVVAQDITEDQALKAIQDGHFDPSYNHMWPTGSFQPMDPKTGKPMVDDQGNPMIQKTFTVIGNVPEVQLDAKNTKLINDNVAGMNFKEGQPLSGAQAGSLIQQAMNHQAVQRKVDFDLEKADVDKLSMDQQKSQLTAINNLGPDFARAMAQSNGDLQAATNYMIGQHKIRQIVNGEPVMVPDPASVQMAKDHPQGYKDIMDAYGGAPKFSAIVDAQRKEQEQIRRDRAVEDEKAAKDLADKVVDVVGVMTDEMKSQIAALPPDRRAMIEKYPNEAGSILAVALGPGDIDFHQIFPPRLTKGAPGINAEQAISAIRAVNPNWSEQQYNSMRNAYKDITQGKEGIQIGQYNNVLQHAAGLQDVMEESSRGKTPAFLNTAINALESKGWGAEAARINTEVEAVKGEYELLMNAGYKPSEAEQTIYNKIVNGSATPGQIGAFTKAVGSVGAVRLEQINEQYKRIAGKNLPGILTKETMDAAKHLNLDNTAMRRLGTLNVGDTIFHNPNYKAPTPTETQQKDNEKQDQEAAATAAKKAAGPPTGASHTVMGHDGKMHYTNAQGTQDFGLVQ